MRAQCRQVVSGRHAGHVAGVTMGVPPAPAPGVSFWHMPYTALAGCGILAG